MKEVPFLKTLEEHKIPVTDDTRERMDIFISNLRREPGAAERLREYGKRQDGGAEENTIPIPVIPDKNDFLGPEMRWLVEVMGSPYAQIGIRMLFTVLFFVSYLEEIPVFGGILSAVLDLTVTGGRILIKTVQKMIPPIMGLIPLPYMSMIGMVVASIFGLLLWPVIAIVSFSRQEFTVAIEAMIRILPPPLGDAIADAFLDANRTVARMNDRRKKISEDIVAGLRSIMSVGNDAKERVSSGATTLIEKLPKIAEQPSPAPAQSGLGRMGTRKRRRNTKREKKFSRKRRIHR